MRPDCRQRMVQSAALLLRQYGFSGTDLRDVIAHSRAPRGAFERLFPGGKRQLAREAVTYAAGSVAVAARGSDPLAVLRDFLGGWRRTLEASEFRAGCTVAAVAIEDLDGDELAETAAAGFARWERMLAAALRDAGVGRGKAARLATLAVASAEGAIVLCRARRDARPLDRVQRELTEAIRAALP